MKEIKQTENSPVKEVWVLLDDKIGHNSQSLGVADALGLGYVKKQIHYSNYAKRPNFLKFDALKSVDVKTSDKIYRIQYPDIIISCGRKLAPISLYIKDQAKKAGKKVFCCHIMLPEFTALSNFDLVAVPQHDIKPKKAEKNNIIKTIGAPNRITKEFLLQEYRIWSRTIGEFPTPKLAVLVGGDTRKGAFTVKQAKELTNQIVNFVSKNNSSVLVSTSRRTPADVSKYIENQLKKRIGRYLYFHDFSKNKANPFYAFLQMADVIVTTADSISMCSEACSIGKPVYIYFPEDILPEKHKYFGNLLIENNFAKDLMENLPEYLEEKFVNKKINILNSSLKIAKEIRKRIF